MKKDIYKEMPPGSGNYYKYMYDSVTGNTKSLGKVDKSPYHNPKAKVRPLVCQVCGEDPDRCVCHSEEQDGHVIEVVDEITFNSSEFNIKKYFHDHREHESHIWPAPIDDFCNLLKSRCIVLTANHVIIKLDSTILKMDTLQRFADVIENYILKPKTFKVEIGLKKVQIQFAGKA